mgnify:CR=1 FL=1
MERELAQNERAIDELGDELEQSGNQADDFGDELEGAAKDADNASSKFDKVGSVVKRHGRGYWCGGCGCGRCPCRTDEKVFLTLQSLHGSTGKIRLSWTRLYHGGLTTASGQRSL